MEQKVISQEKNIKRKKGINKGKFGSVRNINGIIYVDFRYLGERVRESSELAWNPENRKTVRKQLDRIHASIQAGTFRFSNVFPKSKQKKSFAEKEQYQFGSKLTPDLVSCGEYFDLWFKRLEENKEVRQRTLRYYKSYFDCYLYPFFGDKCFSFINKTSLYDFYQWAREKNNVPEKSGKQIKDSKTNKSLAILH